MSDDFLEGLRAAAAAALFPTDGELLVDGLRAPVTIARDAWGIPSIEAADLDDLWFAQGLLTAGERLFQLDLTLRLATGRLSEVFGDRTLDGDRFARTVGFHRAARTHLHAWTDEDHRMHTRFRDGVHAWVAQQPVKPVEYMLLDLEPDIPVDPLPWAAAFAYLAWGLSNNYENELLRVRIAECLGPEAVALLVPSSAGGTGRGSNNWVVAGSKTASGRPLLANDPHLAAVQPGVWLELHLRAPGYEARGVALPFSPGIILGATPHHAWGATNVTGDVQDLYEERLSADGTAALYEGTEEPLTIHREEIAVRGKDPMVLEVRETRHGPILTHFEEGILQTAYRPIPGPAVYALRWTGHEVGIRPTLALDAARATSFEEFRGAVLKIGCPGQNFVYADVDGAIGYQCTGLHPIRRAGDGSIPAPGWVTTHEWDGWIPSEELPRRENPGSGFVATANNDIHDPSSPHPISTDFHEPYRFRRIAQLLEARDDHDVASMRAIQTDTVSLPARETLPLLLRVEPRTDAQREALALLAAWDGDMRADAAAAAVYNAWCTRIAHRALADKLGQDLFRTYTSWRELFRCRALPAMLREPTGWLDDDLLRAALEDALEELRTRLGEDPAGWTWGELHTLVLAHPLAAIPGLEPLFVAAQLPIGGDEQTVAQSGADATMGDRPGVIPSWRAVWDLGDHANDIAVLPAGLSGNPGSPHWNDQAALFGSGRYRPAAFSPEAVSTLTVGPV